MSDLKLFVKSNTGGQVDVFKLIQALSARVVALETKVEKQAQVSYKGIWQSAGHYAEGNLVTYGGALWTAVKDTRSRPGDQDSGWQLAVKSK